MTVYELVRNVFCNAAEHVYHGKASQEPGEYIVWEMSGKTSLRADGTGDTAAGRYTVDIYTRKEFSEIPEKLEALMDSCDEIFWTDPACNYNETTGYRHYVYTLEVV